MIAATDSAALMPRSPALARALGVPVNVADDADHSDFILPAIVDRSPVIVAVSYRRHDAGTRAPRARTDRSAVAGPPGCARPLCRQPARAGEPAAAAGAASPFWERFFGTAANLERLSERRSGHAAARLRRS